jgi:pantoate--beta-alanine ligase
MERDLSVLEQEGVDMVFAPLPEQMYADNFSVHVDEEDLSKGLCGASRPGHFRGVCTVVTKLFNIIRPDRAYFGQKDYQQLQVIKRMVRDLNMPVEVVSCPIVREKDGLAMSSRNLYLTPEERQSALLLNRSLAMARDMVKAGEKSQKNIRQAVMDMLNSDPALSIDYVELKDAEDLKDISEVSRKAVLALAVRVGRARLIDNTVLDPAR